MEKTFGNLTDAAKNLIRRFRQVLLYATIGFSALALELAIFYVLTQHFGLAIWLGNACGVLAGLLFGFTMNARYNFQVSDRKLERFARYGLIAFCGYVLTTILIFGFTSYADAAPFIAKLFSLPPYFLFQYNSNRLFTFQPKGKYAAVAVETGES